MPAPRGAQPPAAAARQAHQHRLAALRQGRLDRRMQVEAHDEAPVGHRDRPAVGAAERVLAAQVAAVGRQPQAAAMDDAVERAVAVMAHVEPLRALVLGAVDQHVAGAIFQRRRGR